MKLTVGDSTAMALLDDIRAQSLQDQEPACAGQGEMWSRVESLHLAARTAEQAVVATAPAVRLCADCPVRDLCSRWATVQGYTGIAAGQVFEHGVAGPASTVLRKRPCAGSVSNPIAS